MTSRPRPSLLALFDPLSSSSSETESSTPTASTTDSEQALAHNGLDDFSPGSFANKENKNIVTTPKNNASSKLTCKDAISETLFFQRTKLVDVPCPPGPLALPVEESFSLHTEMLVDTSNICLEQLGDEYDVSRDNTSEVHTSLEEKEKEERRPLAEKSATTNGVLRSSSGTPSDKSVSKFAAGVNQFDPSTPTGRRESSSLARFDKFTTPSPSISAFDRLKETKKIPAAKLTSSSSSPSTSESSTEAPSPATVNESSLVLAGTSFDIASSLVIKKNSPRSDLLAEEMSFLARMSDDSFADNSRDNGLADNCSAKTTMASEDVNKQSSRRVSLHFDSPTSSLPPSSPQSSCSSYSSDEAESRTACRETETSKYNFRTPMSSPASRVNVTQKAALAPKKSQFSFSGKQDHTSAKPIDRTQSQSQLRSKPERRLSRSVTESSLPSRPSHILPSIIEKATSDSNTMSLRSKAQRPAMTQKPQTQTQTLRSSVFEPKPALNRRLSVGKDALSRSVNLNSSSQAGNGPARPATKGRLSLLGSGIQQQEPSHRDATGPRRVPISSSTAPLLHKTQTRVSSAPSLHSDAQPANTLSTSKSGPKRPPSHRLAASVSSIGAASGGSNQRLSTIGSGTGTSSLRTSSIRSSSSGGDVHAQAGKSSLSRTTGSTMSRLPGLTSQTKMATTSRLPAPTKRA